ncbi:DUF1622 domain-containing protein [Dongshaea marina]|uniref:DUF1622 domain-containing protein n=1 Tax=Dongshaea marina TaxID=2047966 RepID=UPI000D3E4A90|nr:DUF1622 domain-containing protein [Dongshaea marina]
MDEIVHIASHFVVQCLHLLAITVISIGVIKGMVIFIRESLIEKDSATAIRESRLELGYTFSLALGFLIGGSILNTTIAPTWEDIGQLASIIAIRTVLNYFMLRELKAMGALKSAKEKPDPD